MTELLSVIIPIKDEHDNIRRLHERLHAALDPLCVGPSPRLGGYELLFVDDGSVDGSYALLEELAAADRRVKVVRLRRNYGQTPALQAGIDWSRGDVLVTMDGDLQNDPADIPVLLAKLEEGYDAVFGQRRDRKDNLLVRTLPSLAANWLIRKVTATQVKDLGCTLRAMRRDLAEALPLYGEMHRFIAVLSQMHGAKITQLEVPPPPRICPKTAMKRCISPYSGSASARSRRMARSVQPRSLTCVAVTLRISQLAARLGSVRTSRLSLRSRRWPKTAS